MSWKPPYPPEFCAEALRLVTEGGRSIAEVARELGITAESFRHWIRQEQIDHGQQEGLSAEEREELRRLRREVCIPRQEKEILAKATAFFAKEAHKVP